MKKLRSGIIFSMQLCSMLGIWVLFTGIVWWLANSVRNALELHDAPDATIVITIVAMIVFIVLAGVLTYVFVGLQLGREEEKENK